MARIVAVCVLAVGLVGAAADANILVNGGFEDGDLGQIGVVSIPGWSSWGNSGWHHNDAGHTQDSKAILFWWDDAGLWQDFVATPGTTYDFSIDALSASTDPLNLWNGLLKAEFYDSSIGTGPGQALAEVELDRFYSASDPRDQWVTLTGSLVAPAGADIGRIVLKIHDWQDGVSGVLNFDNAVVTPEPAAVVLLGLGAAVMLRRRRA